MGKIVVNGIEYCGTSDTANNIIYDNIESGLTATTMQEAVDEIKDDVDKLGNVISLATFTSSTAETKTLGVPLSNFRYLLLAIIPSDTNHQILASTFVPKVLFDARGLQADYNNQYNTYCQKISETEVRGTVKDNGQIGILYGIR